MSSNEKLGLILLTLHSPLLALGVSRSTTPGIVTTLVFIVVGMLLLLWE